jgi:catechol 2,3-dioxygenase-like lactoylglutathione lyase family enzyme
LHTGARTHTYAHTCARTPKAAGRREAPKPSAARRPNGACVAVSADGAGFALHDAANTGDWHLFAPAWVAAHPNASGLELNATTGVARVGGARWAGEFRLATGQRYEGAFSGGRAPAGSRERRSLNRPSAAAGQSMARPSAQPSNMSLLGARGIDPSLSVVLRGSGGMAKAVAAAFKQAGFSAVTIQVRNTEAGKALATKLGFKFVSDAVLAAKGQNFDILVNATPIGMTGANESELAFAQELIEQAQVIFDVVAFPSETPLIAAARTAGKTVITGAEVIALQAALQFEAYTGVALTADQVRRASEFSRLPA